MAGTDGTAAVGGGVGGDGADHSAEFGTTPGENGIFAGGGGGGSFAAGVDAIGGAGGGGDAPFGDALANTGGGGAGSHDNDTTTQAGDGGNGIVIVKYVTADFGTCTGGTITTSGPNTIHTFTSSGTFGVVLIGAAYRQQIIMVM